MNQLRFTSVRNAVQLLAGFFSILILCVSAFSQGNAGRITGTVTDQSGASSPALRLRSQTPSVVFRGPLPRTKPGCTTLRTLRLATIRFVPKRRDSRRSTGKILSLR